MSISKSFIKQVISILLICFPAYAFAQESSPFKGKIANDEYQVYIEMNFYDNNIVCPNQEIFGSNPGYFGAIRDTRKWIIMDAYVNGNKATLTIINDYGSEDLKATLTYNSDKSFTLERIDGSPIRIVVNNAWVKLPKKLVFHMAKKQ